MGGHEALGEDEVHVWLARPPAVTPAALGISALLSRTRSESAPRAFTSSETSASRR